jgi:TonB family protein
LINLIRYSFILLVLLLPVGFAFSQEPVTKPLQTSSAEVIPTNWKTFESAEGRFSIQFPGTPKVGTEPLDSAGQAVLHKCSLTTKAEYGVIYADYPMKIEGAAAAKQILDDGAKGAVAGVSSELLSISEISLSGNPGRALKERMKDGAIMHARMFLVGQRLYQIAITLPPMQGAKAEDVAVYEQAATRFLDSFKVTAAEETLDAAQAPMMSKCNKTVVGTVKVEDPDPNQKLITGSVLNGQALSLPKPDYPPLARRAHAQGTVAVQVVIDETGNVVAARAVSGHPLLYAASVTAARSARFTPTKLEGQPVCVAGVITYNFVAQ